ncbi:MAG: DUF4976 domain-containing protein, partial [Bryobacterales bacterium]|nr:DUF4976 domain-containing protein [Bryobacterales bacterium]
WQGIRTARYKYVRYPELPDAEELYDLRADPYEKKNLAGEAAGQVVAARLRKELALMLARTA